MIATDPTTTTELAATRTGSDGRFALDVAVPQVAVTATTARESLFVPRADVGGQDLALRLDASCTVLHGQVDIEGPSSAKLDLIRIGRLGNAVGDTFGAPVDAAQRFEACLAPAEYFVTLPPTFAERIILTTVPSSGPFHVRAVAKPHAEQPPAEPLGVDALTRQALVRGLAGSTRVLGLGETNHGSSEFTDERADLAIALATRRQFTLVMIEAGYGETLPLSAYLHGAAIDVDAAIAALGYWIWNTRAFRHALDKFRDYNRTASPGLQIDIVGIDVQNTEAAVADLIEADAGLAPAALDLLARLKDHRGAAWRDVAPSERDSTRSILGAIAARRDPGGLASPVNRHALSARALLRRLELIDAPTFWDKERVRDAGMARMVEDVLDVQPGARATLWAHLGHLARELVVGVPPLGNHLTTALGDSYRAYALVAYSGAARGRDLDRDHAVVAHPLPTAPAYSLEGALAHAMQRPAGLIAYATFDHPLAPRPRWLRELRWIRSFGAAYPGDQKSFELYDLAAIDGAVLFETVTPNRTPRAALLSGPEFTVMPPATVHGATAYRHDYASKAPKATSFRGDSGRPYLALSHSFDATAYRGTPVRLRGKLRAAVATRSSNARWPTSRRVSLTEES